MKIVSPSVSEAVEVMLNRISELWCRKMHSRAMWPIHGRYICPDCLREYRVEWEGPAKPEEYAHPASQPRSLVTQVAPVSDLRSYEV